MWSALLFSNLHLLLSISIPSSWGVQAICSLRLEEQSDPEPHQGPIQPRDNLRAVSRQSVRTGTERQHLCLGRVVSFSCPPVVLGV